MTQVICPFCQSLIKDRDINVDQGIALCRQCSELSRLSDILGDDEYDEDEPLLADVGQPPRGCVIRDEGDRIRVIASARSVVRSIGALFAVVFWNGIVSVFVWVAISATVYQLTGSAPPWSAPPAKGSNGIGPGMPVGMLIGFWVFLSPFITIGTLMFGLLMTSVLGRCEVVVRGASGVVFTGFGPIGWRRRFDPAAVTSVRLGHTTWMENDERQPCIVIEATKTRRIGSILPEARRDWMAAALREVLVYQER